MFKYSQSGFADLDDQPSLDEEAFQLSSQYANLSTPQTPTDDGYGSNQPNSKHYCFMFLRRSLQSGSSASSSTSNSSGLLNGTLDENCPNLEYQMNDAFQAIGYLSSKLSSRFTISKDNIDDCNLEEFWTHVCLNSDDPSSIDNRPAGSSSPQMSFYSSQPSQQNYEYIFVVGSFSSSRFQYLKRHRLRIVSPLAILYWYNLFDECPQEFNFLERIDKATSHGLFSECMDQNLVYISKIFPTHILMEMMDQIRWMGGNISTDLNLLVTHAVGDKELKCVSDDPNIYAAHFLQIPIVGKEWISTSWNQLQLQRLFSSNQEIVNLQLILRYHDLEPKKIFKNLIVGIVESVYDDCFEKMSPIINCVSECVLRFGGLFVKSHTNLRYASMNVVLHLSENLELAELYRKDRNFVTLNEQRTKPIPILNVQWFFDTIVNQSVQSYEPYLIPVQLKGSDCQSITRGPYRDLSTSPYGPSRNRHISSTSSSMSSHSASINSSKNLFSDEVGWMVEKANK